MFKTILNATTLILTTSSESIPKTFISAKFVFIFCFFFRRAKFRVLALKTRRVHQIEDWITATFNSFIARK